WRRRAERAEQAVEVDAPTRRGGELRDRGGDLAGGEVERIAELVDAVDGVPELRARRVGDERRGLELRLELRLAGYAESRDLLRRLEDLRLLATARVGDPVDIGANRLQVLPNPRRCRRDLTQGPVHRRAELDRLHGGRGEGDTHGGERHVHRRESGGE